MDNNNRRKRARDEDSSGSFTIASFTTEYRCLDRTPTTAVTFFDGVAKAPQKRTVCVIMRNNEAVDLFKKGDVKRSSCIFQDLINVVSPNKTSKTRCVSKTLSPDHDYDEGLSFFRSPHTIMNHSHPDVVAATVMFNAGQAVRKEANLQRASSFFQMALNHVLPHLSGPEETSIPQLYEILVPILNCVALIEYKEGAHEQASAYYKLAIDYAKTVEPKSASVGAALNGLGTIMINQTTEKKDLKQSLAYILESADIFSRRLGTESTQVASVYNNLGRVYAKIGDSDNSLLAFNKARMLRKKLLGTNHIDYGASLFNSAQTLHFMCRYDEAISLYHSFLIIDESALPQRRRDVAVGLSHMANCYHKKGDNNNAQTYFERSIQLGEQVFKDQPLEVAMLLGEFGNFWFASGCYTNSLATYQDAFAIEEKILEDDHPNITLMLGNIAESFRRLGRLQEAIECYKKVARLLKQRQGCQSAKAAAALTVVGLVQEQNGEVFAAIKTLQEALAMKKVSLGEEHTDCGHILLYLGTIFCRIQRLSDALGLLKESYRIFVSQLGDLNESVACALYNIGVCRQQQGDQEAAIQGFKKALKIHRKLSRSEGQQRQMASTLFKLGEMHSFGGENEKASAHFQEAYQILEHETIFDSEEPEALTSTLNKLCGLYILMGETGKMINLLTKAARLFRCCGIPLERIDVSSAVKEYEVRGGIGPPVA